MSALRKPVAAAAQRPVYYVSDRPEAYEFWGEVNHDSAASIGRLIAAQAGRKFPEIEFRVDAGWHLHQPGMEGVTAFIEDRLPAWVAEVLGK